MGRRAWHESLLPSVPGPLHQAAALSPSAIAACLVLTFPSTPVPVTRILLPQLPRITGLCHHAGLSFWFSKQLQCHLILPGCLHHSRPCDHTVTWQRHTGTVKVIGVFPPPLSLLWFLGWGQAGAGRAPRPGVGGHLTRQGQCNRLGGRQGHQEQGTWSALCLGRVARDRGGFVCAQEADGKGSGDA